MWSVYHNFAFPYSQALALSDVRHGVRIWLTVSFHFQFADDSLKDARLAILGVILVVAVVALAVVRLDVPVCPHYLHELLRTPRIGAE